MTKQKVKGYNLIFKVIQKIIFLILLLLILVYLPTTLWHFPDGIGYYSYLPAVFKFKNYDFYNIFRNYTSGIIGITKSGFLINDFDIGCSVVWFFVYHISMLFEKETISILFVNFFSSVLGLSGLIILFKFLVEKLNFDKTNSFFICLNLLLGTPLLFYIYSIPQNPHITSYFLCSLYFYFLLSQDEFKLRRYLFSGILLGIISSLRLQRIILIILPMTEIFSILIKTKDFKKFVYSIFMFILGISIGFSPQIINSKILFSSFIPPKFYTIKLTKYFFSSIYEILFGSYHSVLLWTPLMIVSVVGLLIGIKYNFFLSLNFILIFILETFVIATVISPGGGASFGIRYYTDISFVFGLGLYFLFRFSQQNRKILFFVKMIILLCSLWSLILFLLSTSGKIDLIEVYSVKDFFSNIIFGLKNFRLSLRPRYYTEGEIYIFLFLILVLTVFINYKLCKILSNTKDNTIWFMIIILSLYLLYFDMKLINSGIFNRVVYKKEVFEQSLNEEDYKNFYNLAGIKVRLKYYSLTRQEEKYNFFLRLKEKYLPKSYLGKKFVEIYIER
ncbi:MAG: hypothetical protein ACK4WJ_01565 [Endomicrobiia bacterium]